MARTIRFCAALCCACTMCAPGFAAGRGGNYLIVAAPTYQDSAPLNQFIAHRTARGFNVLLYVPPVGTSNTAIKQHIQSVWETDRPEYLLIVGDTSGASTSTSTNIPHWNGGGSHGAPTDLPYACMDSDPVSWYPDMHRGRFSVTSVAMLQDVVDKTITVESGSFSDPDYIRRAALLANDDPTTLADALHDWVIDTYLTPAGFTPTRLYADQGADTADVSAAVNAGTLFTVYFGHSGTSGWWAPSFYQEDVSALTNDGLYGLTFGWSCSSAYFPSDECFGETWLRAPHKGAAAYLSAAMSVWWGSVEEWESSRRMERYFFQSFFGDNIWEVGPAWDAALARIYNDPDFGPSHSHTRDIFEGFVLLGDPALRLPSHDVNLELLSAIPEFIPPYVPFDLTLRIICTGEEYLPGSATLHYSYDAGATYQTAPMAELGDDLFRASLPAPDCDAPPRFYFTAQGDAGTIGLLPVDAPAAFYTARVATVTSIASDDFQVDRGWTVSSAAGMTSGIWQRATPLSSGPAYAPFADADGSGKCFVTDNRSGYDVDGGPTVLTSPIYDLSAWSNPYVRYSGWMFCDDTTAPTQDFLDVECSPDGGANWVRAEHYSGLGGWVQHEIRLRDFIEPTAQFRIRFSIADQPNNSSTEAAIDAVWIHDRACGPAYSRGDLNCDGALNTFDIDPFVLALTDPTVYVATYPLCDPQLADANCDGAVNTFDIDPFVQCLTGGCPPCP